MKRIYANEKHCIACRLCEITCLVRRSKSKNIVKAFRNERDRITPGVKVEESGRLSFALQCRQCADAPCVEACISGAMRRDPVTLTVVCDEDKCLGCWSCIMVCPAGAITPGKSGKAASKCDLCMGEKTPVCVENCPNGALVYEERKG